MRQTLTYLMDDVCLIAEALADTYEDDFTILTPATPYLLSQSTVSQYKEIFHDTH